MLLRGREGIDRLLNEEECAVMCWCVFLTDDLLIYTRRKSGYDRGDSLRRGKHVYRKASLYNLLVALSSKS